MSESTYPGAVPRTRTLPRMGDSGTRTEPGPTLRNAAVPETNAALKALQSMLRPLIRILLRSGVSFGTFSEIAKQVFVEVAHTDFQVPGRKASIAHTSVLTGMTRKEVARRLTRKLPVQDATRYNRAVRVISGWTTDPRFSDPDAGPRPLEFASDTDSFSELVHAYSGDIPARTLLDELLRVGAVRKGEDGRIRLLHRAYVPGNDVAEKLGILGSDVADLVACIDHNLTADAGRTFFQRKVAYSDLSAVMLPQLRQHVGVRAQKLLEELQTVMRSSEQGSGPDRARAMVGIYYYEAIPGAEPPAADGAPAASEGGIR